MNFGAFINILNIRSHNVEPCDTPDRMEKGEEEFSEV
jgi:hypothetical protein